jgi:hypothetical protein
MQPLLSAHRLIFLDEIGVATNMVRREVYPERRRRGRAPKGKRVMGYAPGGYWKITTFLVGLDRNGIVAPSSSISR